MESQGLPISRRTVLAGMAGAVALAGCGGGGAPSSSVAGGLTASSSAPPLATAEAAAWMAATGSRFRSGSYTLQLAGIEMLGTAGNRPAELRQQTFIAAFGILAGGDMPGDLVYTISHASIPTFDIFLSNNATVATRMHALFN